MFELIALSVLAAVLYVYWDVIKAKFKEWVASL